MMSAARSMPMMPAAGPELRASAAFEVVAAGLEAAVGDPEVVAVLALLEVPLAGVVADEVDALEEEEEEEEEEAADEVVLLAAELPDEDVDDAVPVEEPELELDKEFFPTQLVSEPD